MKHYSFCTLNGHGAASLHFDANSKRDALRKLHDELGEPEAKIYEITEINNK